MKPARPFAFLVCSSLCAAPALGQWSQAKLVEARLGLAATSVGTKVIFGGGIDNGGDRSNVVDIYDVSTDTWSVAALTVKRGYLAATTVGTKALFAGGGSGIGQDAKPRVDIYDDSTGTWSTAVLSKGRTSLAATTVGTKAIFAGGFGQNQNSLATVDIYDDSTGTWSTATLSIARGDLAATTVGTKAMFAGGWGGGPSLNVDIYDDSTDTWSTALLSEGRERLAAVTVGDLAFFAGGGTNTLGDKDIVDIYDNSTDTWSTAMLSETREFLAAAAVGNLAIFGGGYNGIAGSTTTTADIYNVSTGTWTADNLSAARWGLAATSLGNKAFFGGGSGSDVVDIYTLGGPVGTNYCGPANLNSTGLPALISGFGTEAVLANFLELTASQLPQNQFGMFLNSMTQGFVANPGGSQGNLCLGGSIGRYNRPGEILNSGAGGTFTLVLDLTDTPQPTGSVSIVPGETWNFQVWFRDKNPGPTSNFTDGLSILFQ